MIKAAAPHHTEHRKRLKARYKAGGISGFHDYEIFELLLSYAIPRKDVKPPAKALLAKFHDFKGILDADLKELEDTPGLGAHSAILMKLVKDVSAIYLGEKARKKVQISSSRELLDYCKMAFGGLKDERFSAIYLDAQNKIIEIETVQEGIVNQAVVYPRKILENALRKKATALILVHNHPSGEVRPSPADIQLTKTIRDTGRALNIDVHDHIIVGENNHFSFREEGIVF
ncbi:MAG: DNA repair protein RadC [Smithellaceae bacterium]|nr:DNA repair protein RadC [Smithellaceae bacterium]